MNAANALARRILASQFLRFALVGTAGFVVNEAALWAVHGMTGLNYYWSQPFAFLIAVTFTWWGNRALTFRDQAARENLIHEWGRFVVANGLGAIANYALYAGMLRFAPPPADNPYLALAAGTLFGLIFNFTLSRRFVFRPR